MRTIWPALPASAAAFLGLGSLVVAWLVSAADARPARGSCSTFLMRTEGDVLVGHDLDERFEAPGALRVNPRGGAKQRVSWDDVKAVGPSRSQPCLRWVSKYGALTFNAMGREFPDGGISGAGLFVGEMLLLGTQCVDVRVLR